jgi:hypothetical protein
MNIADCRLPITDLAGFFGSDQAKSAHTNRPLAIGNLQCLPKVLPYLLGSKRPNSIQTEAKQHAILFS